MASAMLSGNYNLHGNMCHRRFAIASVSRASLSEVIKRHCRLKVSTLDSGSSCPGSSPGRDHCVMFLGQCLSPRVTRAPLKTTAWEATQYGKVNGCW